MLTLTVLPLHSNDPSIQASVASLKSALSSVDRQHLLDAFTDPGQLSRLEDTRYDTTVQKRVKSHAVVGVWFSSKAFVNSMRQRKPSFFLDGAQTSLEPHIQVLESVARKRFCVLLSFKNAPSSDGIEASIGLLRRQLKLPKSSRVMATPPLHLSVDRRLFRIDGTVAQGKAFTTLSTELRKAIIETARAYEPLHLRVTPQSREPVRWVFILRQSQEDYVPTKTSIPRQLWSMLVSKDAPFERLGKSNRISVVVELCSSNKHPFQDRTVLTGLPDDLPMIFLTANPDRMTRRENEIDSILERGEWFTRGLRGNTLHWTNVRALKDVVSEQVKTGKRPVFIRFGTMLTYKKAVTQHRKLENTVK